MPTCYRCYRSIGRVCCRYDEDQCIFDDERGYLLCTRCYEQDSSEEEEEEEDEEESDQ